MPLRVQPRLASWNKSGHPDQVRLSAALTDAVDVLADAVAATSGPATLSLNVGLAEGLALEHHDLDNYLYPVTKAVLPRLTNDLVSVWGTKRNADASTIGLESAVAVEGESDFDRVITTSASGTTVAYKEQIADQLGRGAELPSGPVALESSFIVGQRRNWLNLWKPTIDALDQLLGRTRPDRAWHPRDGRIVDLGMHRAIDPRIGNSVIIGLRARAVELS
jgi:hypothetical protein